VTGNTIGALLRERIFPPLRLQGTSFPSTARLPQPFWNGYPDKDVSGGFNTTVAYLPKEKSTVVVLTNTDAEAFDSRAGEPALPAPVISSALAKVITPSNVPTGTH